MSKIEELKQVLQATGLTLPIHYYPSEQLLGDDEHELICYQDGASTEEMRLVTMAVNALPTLLEAAELVSQARSLISEAVNEHIYDEDNGDVPEPDCRFMAFLKAAKTLQEKLK